MVLKDKIKVFIGAYKMVNAENEYYGRTVTDWELYSFVWKSGEDYEDTGCWKWF